MAEDHENFGGVSHGERRVCSLHSGVDTKQTILMWLLGILIVAILSNVTVMQGVRDSMSDLRVELAGLKSDKATSNEIHSRLNERISILDRRVESISEKR